MQPLLLLKVGGASALISLIAIAGIWFNVYEDESLKIDLRLLSYNPDNEIIILEANIENKLNQDIVVHSIRYSAYLDEGKTILLSTGVIERIELPANENVRKTINAQLSNVGNLDDKIYFDAVATYQIGGEGIESVTIEKTVKVPCI